MYHLLQSTTFQKLDLVNTWIHLMRTLDKMPKKITLSIDPKKRGSLNHAIVYYHLVIKG